MLLNMSQIGINTTQDLIIFCVIVIIVLWVNFKTIKEINEN